MDETFYTYIGADSCPQTLVVMEYFKHLDICWRDKKAGHKTPSRFLECVDDNSLLKVIEELTSSYAGPFSPQQGGD